VSLATSVGFRHAAGDERLDELLLGFDQDVGFHT